MAFVFQAVRILIYVASGNLPIVCGREMASAGLSGTISSGIGNLSHLQTLWVATCNWNGLCTYFVYGFVNMIQKWEVSYRGKKV